MYNDHASVASLRPVDGMTGTRGRFHRSTQPPMLKAEERFMIKDLHRRGMTVSDIARITGHCF
jgi:hypothetical protein